MSEARNLINKIFLGEVASVQNYGAFIRIPGTKLQGLVHRTQISNSNVEDVNDVLQKNDKVWCKAVKLTDDGKISLSMKVVNQGNGNDLDPNGVKAHQDEQRRKERPVGGGRKRIELEAVLNVNCSKCGTRGHLSKDCFQDPSGKTYDLLPEDDDTPVSSKKSLKRSHDEDKDDSRKKKKRKEKKEKKKSKKKRKSSDSSSSEDYSHKKKKHKKSRT